MTAQIIAFPIRARTPRPLSVVALAIYRDMNSRARDNLVLHSIIDGEACSGASKGQVVKARRELQDRCLVVKLESGDGNGPTVWRLCTASLAGVEPDGAA